jgi:hypothetical protein
MKKVLLLTLICFGFVFSQVLQESFDGPLFPPEGWRVYNCEDTWNNIPHGEKSVWEQDGHGPHTTPGCAFCRKTYGQPPVHIPNNDWLVTPRVFPSENANDLTFYYRGFTKNQNESLEVWVSRGGYTPADFQNPATGYRVDAFGMKVWDYTLRVVSLASFINQPIYIAFRYCGNNPNRHGVFIDDVNTDPNYPPIDLIPLDVGVIEIHSPNTIMAPVEFYPSAKVKNFGPLNANFETKCFIYNQGNVNPVYTSTVQINGLEYNMTVDPTFDPITLTPGNYQVKFKTFLPGDQNASNDEMTRAFEVLDANYHDVGVTEIITPIGEVTLPSLHPKVVVENFGSQTKTFEVKIEITNSYTGIPAHSEVTSITLPSLISSELEFPTSWTAVPSLYPYQVKAFTRLADDQNRSNDTVTVTAIIPLTDGKVSAIYEKNGTNYDALQQVYEPGQTMIPAALISNRSFTQEEINIPSTFSISKVNASPVYTNNQTVLLGFCDDANVDYEPWIADTGNFIAKCKTNLTGDNNHNNDSIVRSIFVPFRDVAPIYIEAPEDEFQKQEIVPRAVVDNNSNYYIHAPIAMTIKYNGVPIHWDTNYVTIFEGVSGMVFFPAWEPEYPGTYNITFKQIFPYDMVPENDIISKDFVVLNPNIDLAVLQIKAPKDSIAAGAQIYPRVRVFNYGDVPVNGQIITEISSQGTKDLLYIDTVAIQTPIPPNTERTLTFSRTTIVNTGGYQIHSIALVDNDNNPTNNEIQEIFTASSSIFRDVGTASITEPKGRKPIGMITAQAIIHNYGNSQENFQVQLKIYRTNQLLPVYAPIVNVELDPQETQIVYFPNWAADLGNFIVRCTTLLTGDQTISNNFLDTLIEIYQPINTGWVTQKQFGNSPNTYLVKEGGALTYVPGKGIYAFQGNKRRDFYFYDIETDNWTKKADLPDPIVAGKGAALCNDGNNRIYAITGKKTVYFFTYDIAQDLWLRLDDVPPAYKPKKINGGSGLAYISNENGDFVYLVKGNNTYEVWAYSIQGDSWFARAEVNRGPTTKGKVKDGSSLTTDGGYFIYLLKASFNELHRYDVLNDVWFYDGDIGAKPLWKKVSKGSAMAYSIDAVTGNPMIYAFKGNSFEFWKYNIVTGTWYTRTSMHMLPGLRNKKVGAGGSLVYVPELNVFYALKGNKTTEFYKYIPDPNPTEGDIAVNPSTIRTNMTNNIDNLLNTYLKVHPKITNSAARIFYQVNLLKPMTIKLYDNTGALVKNVRQPLNSKSGVISLDVADVSAGVYFIRIQTEENNILEKIVVQK